MVGSVVCSSGCSIEMLASRWYLGCQKSQKVKISQRPYFCLFRDRGHKVGWFNASCQKVPKQVAQLKVLKLRIKK